MHPFHTLFRDSITYLSLVTFDRTFPLSGYPAISYIVFMHYQLIEHKVSTSERVFGADIADQLGLSCCTAGIHMRPLEALKGQPV